MAKIILLLMTIGMNILANWLLVYPATGCLENLICKKWWDVNMGFDKNRHDYIAVLAVSSFAWGLMTFIPCMAYAFCKQLSLQYSMILTGVMVVSSIIHGITVHRFTNKESMSLITLTVIHTLLAIFAWGSTMFTLFVL